MSIDPEKVKELLDKRGPRGATLLSYLNKQSKFVLVLNTEIGKEILNDVIILTDELLSKIINEVATPEEKAEYRVLIKILNTWSDRVSAFTKNIDKLSKGEL